MLTPSLACPEPTSDSKHLFIWCPATLPNPSLEGRWLTRCCPTHPGHCWTRSTSLVCVLESGEQGSKQMIRTHTGPCAEREDYSKFSSLSGTWCVFWQSPRLAEWSLGSVRLPTEGEHLCILVCRYCCNKRCSLGFWHRICRGHFLLLLLL